MYAAVGSVNFSLHVEMSGENYCGQFLVLLLLVAMVEKGECAVNLPCGRASAELDPEFVDQLVQASAGKPGNSAGSTDISFCQDPQLVDIAFFAEVFILAP